MLIAQAVLICRTVGILWSDDREMPQKKCECPLHSGQRCARIVALESGRKLGGYRTGDRIRPLSDAPKENQRCWPRPVHFFRDGMGYSPTGVGIWGEIAEGRREWEKRIGRDFLDHINVNRDNENGFVIDQSPIIWIKGLEVIIGLCSDES